MVMCKGDEFIRTSYPHHKLFVQVTLNYSIARSNAVFNAFILRKLLEGRLIEETYRVEGERGFH